MNNIALGQYVDRNSIIHHLDPRTKFISLIIMMVAVFLIPSPLKTSDPIIPFIALGVVGMIIIAIVLLTKISVFKFLKSIKQIFFLLLITFTVQLLTPSNDGITIVAKNLHISWQSILIIVSLFIIFIMLRKYLPFKMLIFLGLVILSIYILTIPIGTAFSNPTIKIYQKGLYSGAFFVLRIFLVIMLSTVLTLTTKPTDLTSALEWILHPLTYLKINVSIFAMLISLALRFIPTLFNESQKILKSQASRGVDFKEGNLKSQINQIIALLIPMFVIAYKRALDLADAMEARAYIPGEKRTKINKMHFRISDYFSFLLVIAIISFVIIWRVI